MDPGRKGTRKSAAKRDLVALAVVAVVAFVLAVRFEAFEAFERWADGHEHLQIDELAALSAILVLGFAVCSFRRWSEARRDLAAHMQAERRLEEAEKKHRTLIEQIPAITYVDPVDEWAPSMYVSPQIQEILGSTQEEWVGDTGFWRSHLHPDDEERVWGTYVEHRDRGEGYVQEYRMVRDDGRTVWIREQATVLRDEKGDPWVIQGLMHDITDRKLVEEQLLDAETLYRNLVEQISAITYIQERGQDGRVLYMSPQAEALWGYSVGEWLKDPRFPYKRLIHPEDRERVAAEDVRTVGTGEPFVIDYRVQTRDGRVRWVHELATLLRDDNGEPKLWQGVIFDITERKEAEEALRAAEDKYRALVEQIPAVPYVWEVKPEGRGFTYISPRIESVLGFTQEEWLADPLFVRTLLHQGDRERAIEESERTDATEEQYEVEYRVFAKDGRTVWLRDTALPVQASENGHRRWQGVLLDVSEAKRAEEERAHLLQRLVDAQEEERRRISDDIHDDSVQKLTAVGLRLQTLRRQIADGSHARTFDQLDESVQVAIKSLRNLLFDLRPPALDQEGLGSALRQFLERAEHEGTFEGHLTDEVEEELPSEARAIAYRIAQEAITNARKHAGASRLDVHLDSRDDGVRVRIADDGVGFSVEEGTQPRPGHLGMSGMRERAELAGGWWRVDSASGEGTTVEFWLPSRTEASPRRRQETSAGG